MRTWVNAIIAKDIVLLENLYEKGYDLDETETDGRTALMQLCVKGNTEFVKWFIEKGANVNATDDRGNTPLMFAAFADHHEVVKLLLDHGADDSLVDYHGRSAINDAIRENNINTIHAFLERIERLCPKNQTLLKNIRLSLLFE